MPKQRPKKERKAPKNAANQQNNISRHQPYTRSAASSMLMDEEVSRLNSLHNLAALSGISSFAQMTPTHLLAANQLSGFASMPYHSPITQMPSPYSIAQTHCIENLHDNSPFKPKSIKRMNKKEFEKLAVKKIEDKVEAILSRVDNGLEYLQKEATVKERLRAAVTKRHPCVPQMTGSSPVGPESIFYTPSPSPTFVSRIPGSSNSFTPIAGMSPAMYHVTNQPSTSSVAKTIALNNNLMAKVVENDARGLNAHGSVGLSWSANHTPVTPGVNSQMNYSPFVVTAHQNRFSLPVNPQISHPNLNSQLLLFNPQAPMEHQQPIFK